MKKILKSDAIKIQQNDNIEDLKKAYNRDQMFQALCSDCGKLFQRRVRFLSFPLLCCSCQKKATVNNHYGVDNISQLQSVKDKKLNTFQNKSKKEKQKIIENRKQTLIKKYGVDSYFKTPEFKKRMIEHNPGATEEAIKKRLSTIRNKYGVDNAFQNEEIKQKIKETFLKKYGVEYPSQVKSIKDKVEITNIERYGVKNPMQYKSIALKSRSTTEENALKYADENDLFLVKDLKNIYKGHWESAVQIFNHKGYTYIKKEDLKKVEDYCSLNMLSGVSYEEKEVTDFVKSICDSNVIENSRKIIYPKELDVYVPEKKVAIEFDGLFWHSELNISEPSKYHLNKTNECEKKNIRLIHIFEDEWREKQSIIKSVIAVALGVYDHKYYARNLKFKQIDASAAREFFSKNHIQGFCQASYHFGLIDDKSDLLQCISLGKNRFTKDKSKWELIRMASQLNTQVVGGFSKLIKDSMKALGIHTIESYVDRRLFSCSGYISSGWKIAGESKPRYFYTDGKNRYNRQMFMKKACLNKWPESDSNKTEHQLCLEHGLFQIYDCGTVKMKFSTN